MQSLKKNCLPEMETFFEICFKRVMKTQEKEGNWTQIKNKISLESLGCFLNKNNIYRAKTSTLKREELVFSIPKN